MSAPAAARSAARSEPTGFGGPEDYRRLFWRALKVAHRVTENKRQAFCRRVIRGDHVSIEMRPHRRGGDRASFGGLFHCGRNGCPVCGPKIAAERAADIALAITSWYAQGGRVAFSTWTMRHGAAQSLVGLLGAMGRAWTAVRQNKTPRALREAHSVGEIVKLETTVGRQGWHPHKHVLTFLKPGTTDEAAAALDAAEFRAWSASLERQGYGTADRKGHEHRVLELGQAHELVADYVAKSLGHELAAAGTKRARGENRTPLELLLDLDAVGLDADRRLWLEHEAAMSGKRILRWSPGLRDRLIGDLGPELSDQEAADSDDGAGRVIALIGEDTWRRVWRFRHPPSVLLSAAEAYEDDVDRADAVARYLARHGLGELEAGQSNPPVAIRRRGP